MDIDPCEKEQILHASVATDTVDIMLHGMVSHGEKFHNVAVRSLNNFGNYKLAHLLYGTREQSASNCKP